MIVPVDPIAVALLVTRTLDALGARLDRRYLESNAPILGVSDLLERALNAA